MADHDSSSNVEKSSGLKRAASVCTKVTSMSSLISDVLMLIFEHATSMPARIAHGETAVDALKYSQVCKRWRTLAIAKPSLWASIDWGGASVKEPTDERFIVLWDLYLSRSKQAPFSAKLFLDGRSDSVQTRQHLLDSIFSEQHRLQSLIVVASKEAIPGGKSYLLDSAPKLQNLDLDIWNNEFLPVLSNASVTVDLSGMRSLRNIYLNGDVSVMHELYTLDSLRASMLHIIGAGTPQTITMSTSYLFAFLRSAPRITNAEYTINDADIALPTAKHLVMSDLQKLVIRLNTGSFEALDSLLRNLDLPSLDTFELEFSIETVQTWRWRNASALKTLRSLTLRCLVTSNSGPVIDGPEGIRSLLQCTPALQELQIYSNCISSRTLSILSARAPGSIRCEICPALESLRLIRHVATNAVPGIAPQEIIDLISSRWREPQENVQIGGVDYQPSLKYVYLQLKMPGLLNLSDTEPIRSFRKCGLNFKMDMNLSTH
ncbi:hypothetical protein SCHPADRAFT_939787 [Schizopora paradoxa]|uniref:Uncharacterized protein n=1 Tax=Schizopora paradoxa TaxID=27342 RepID=A0A0H2RQ63_9AGAM|nr:hypothetical protein SCHPADRAFT_939787 [Schizopora paradoxa]